jgi:hypothetical protein
VLLVAGAAAWLQATYQPPAPASPPQVELALPAPERAPEPAPAQEAAQQAPAAPEEPAPSPPPPAAPTPPQQAAEAPQPQPAPEPQAPPPSPQVAAQPPQPEEPARSAEPSPPAQGAGPLSPAPAASPPVAPEQAAPQPERQAAPPAPQKAAEAWRAHAQPFEGQPGWPRIAVVIWDLGLSPEPTRAAIKELPPEVTLGVAPYGSDLQKWVDQARAAGHEVVLQAPMEPERFPENDPGPHTLLTGLAPAENLERLDWVLGRIRGYVGVVNYMGSRFTASAEDLKPVLNRIKERGLIFLDSRASTSSVADRLAGELGLAHAANTRYLDNEASRAAIDARLEELEKAARERGWAVGIGYHYPVTIDRLSQWAKTLPAKGLQLAPLSAVARQENGGG